MKTLRAGLISSPNPKHRQVKVFVLRGGAGRISSGTAVIWPHSTFANCWAFTNTHYSTWSNIVKEAWERKREKKIRALCPFSLQKMMEGKKLFLPGEYNQESFSVLFFPFFHSFVSLFLVGILFPPVAERQGDVSRDGVIISLGAGFCPTTLCR